MEKKKELLIKVLKKLESHRNLVPGILALVQSSYVDEKAIDGVLHIISDSIKTVKKETEKNILKEGKRRIEKIRAMEEKERMSEEKIDKLLSDI